MDDLAAINQAAGNIQVNGQWMTPAQAINAGAIGTNTDGTAVMGTSGPVQMIGTSASPDGGVSSPSIPPQYLGGGGVAPSNQVAGASAPDAGNPSPPGPIAQAARSLFQDTSAPNPAAGLQNEPTPAPAAAGPSSVPIPTGVGFVSGAAPQAQGQATAPMLPLRRAGGGAPTGLNADHIFQTEAQDEATAAKEAAGVETAKSAGELAVGQDLAKQQADLNAQRQKAYADAANQSDAALTKSKQLADQFIGQTVDPQRYWNNMGTGDHVLAGLSMILSGIGSGITGQPNLAVKHFDDAVTQDIAAQRDNIEHGKEASEMYTKLATEFQAAGLNKQHALDATDLAIKQKALTDATNSGLALGGQDAKAKLDAALAPLTANAAMGAQKLKQDVNQAALIKAQTANAYAEAAQKRAEAANIPIKNAQARAAGVVQGPDGSLGYALGGAEGAKAFNDEAKPAQDIQQVLDQIDAARKTGVWRNQSQLNVLAARLHQAVAGLGDIKESARTEEIINGMTGDPAQYFSLNPGNHWAGREQALRGVAGNALESAGKRHNIQWERKPATSIKQTPVGAGG